MTAIVTRGNAADLHLPDETVDLVVTSPPYFGLRSYQDGGEHYEGQVGDEATPTEYLDALIACTREWLRVLKPGGSIFVNLGDKYAGSPSGPRSGMPDGATRKAEAHVFQTRTRTQHVAPTKSLQGLPWRYAIRCIDELGLILRAEIVWAKPNGLPESVTDRVRRSHEQVFHFVKQARYYSAVDEVREGLSDWSAGALNGRWKRRVGAEDQGRYDGGEKTLTVNPLGSLPGSVWTIATAPLKVPHHLGIDHFAAYPPELVRRIVLGWSPREVCTACGEGRRPVVVRGSQPPEPNRAAHRLAPGEAGNGTIGFRASKLSGQEWNAHRAANPDTITGYACACPDVCVHGDAADTAHVCSAPKVVAPSTSGVVLDPFGGTGTTALVASAFDRVGISVDLSSDYCRLAAWRTTDPAERARVLGVDKPPVQVDGQLGMFEGLGA